MTLADFIFEKEYKNVVIIDDELALVMDDAPVSQLRGKSDDLRFILAESLSPEEINSFSMEELRKRDYSCFSQICESLEVNEMIKAVDFMKEAGLQVDVFGDFKEEGLTCNENTIWIIDNIIEKDGGTSKAHIQNSFRRFVSNRELGKNDIFLVYTNNTRQLGDYSSVKEFIQTNGIMKDPEEKVLYFNVVPKERMLDVNLFEEIFVKAAHADYFCKVSEIIRESLDKFQSALWSSKEAKNQIFYNYRYEGVTNEQNFFGIILSNVANDYRVHKNEASFTKVLKRLNDVADYELLSEDNGIKKFVGRFLHEWKQLIHCEIVDQTVNELGQDISFGDVFRIKERYYLVVSQQCDITIRNNSRGSSFFTLIPIKASQIGLLDLAKRLFRKNKEAEKLNLKKDEVFASVLSSLLSAVECPFFEFDFQEKQIKAFMDSAKEKIPGNPVEIPYLIKRGDKHYEIGIDKRERPLIVDCWVMDVLTHFKRDALKDEEACGDANLREPSRNLLYESLKKAREKTDFDQFLQQKYDFSWEDCSRVGNVPVSIAGHLYQSYLAHHTRDALLVFEKV